MFRVLAKGNMPGTLFQTSTPPPVSWPHGHDTQIAPARHKQFYEK